MAKSRAPTPQRPAQSQKRQPGRESPMMPRPESSMSSYRSAGRLQGRVAIISGGDSGIGRAVAIGMAKEGADIVIAYRDEHEDAHETASLVQATGRRCLNLAGDVASVAFCKRVVDRAMKVCKRIDIVVNNAAEQHAAEDLTQIDAKTMGRTFATNIFGTFHLTQAALPHLGAGSSVIMTTSVVAYRGSPHLIDYAATKGALVAYTRSLALSLIDRGIRVNAVAPGPVWTPLIPSTFPPEKVATFGSETPMKRAGQPDEVAPAFIFLASDDASYITGQTIHVNGGEIING